MAVGAIDSQGNKNGTWVYMHKSNPYILCNYNHGVMDGACSYICSSDTPRIERMYEMKNDTLQGFIYRYRKDGHIQQVTRVQNFMMINEFEYDHDTISFQKKWWGPEPEESSCIRTYNEYWNSSTMFLMQPLCMKVLLCVLLVQLFTNILWNVFRRLH